MPLLVAVLALLAAAAPAAAAADWRRPVPGERGRPFHYVPARPFAAGQHRGLDLAAPPGTRVRSACAGVVAFAGRVPGQGRTVSVRCGAFRVTYLPLASIAVRRGAPVAAGTPVGTAAAGHGGALHLGVRRQRGRFAYVDPEPLLGGDLPPPPVAVAPPRLGPAPPPAPRPAARPVAAPVAAPAGAPSLAPWPAWLGLALLLTGAAGSRTVALRRRRRRGALRPAGARR